MGFSPSSLGSLFIYICMYLFIFCLVGLMIEQSCNNNFKRGYEFEREQGGYMGEFERRKGKGDMLLL